MKDKYENMTSEQLTKAFEKLGIVKMIDRTESAEDPNIRFSRFDTCYISEIQYVDRLSEITRRYTRLSDTFERAYQVLKDWYEIDEYQYRREKDFLSCDYGFTSKYDLPSITIDINKFQNTFGFKVINPLYSKHAITMISIIDNLKQLKLLTHKLFTQPDM